MKVGDKLAEVAGKKIRRYSDLQTALGTKYAGDAVSISVLRGDQKVSVKDSLCATVS